MSNKSTKTITLFSTLPNCEHFQHQKQRVNVMVCDSGSLELDSLGQPHHVYNSSRFLKSKAM